MEIYAFKCTKSHLRAFRESKISKGEGDTSSPQTPPPGRRSLIKRFSPPTPKQLPTPMVHVCNHYSHAVRIKHMLFKKYVESAISWKAVNEGWLQKSLTQVCEGQLCTLQHCSILLTTHKMVWLANMHSQKEWHIKAPSHQARHDVTRRDTTQ